MTTGKNFGAFRQNGEAAAFVSMMGLPSSANMNCFQNATEDWRVCFARYGPRLLLFARQWLPSVADAEDAVQDGFVRFWRRGGLRASENQGLLFAAVRTAALDHLRRESRRRRREQTALDEQILPSLATYDESLLVPLVDEDSAEGSRELEAALKQLPAEQREVLVLKIWGELTHEEIGAALAIPANTAASRYRYALTHLKKLLLPHPCHGRGN